MGRQQYLCADNAALVGVVAVLAVILAVQFFACSVGSGCNNGLTFAAFDLIYMEMI